MGPKSDKKSKTKCQYFDRGFCYKDKVCSKVHPDKVCDVPSCFDDNCKDRHPNPCKFGNRCKFNIKNGCLYSHTGWDFPEQGCKNLARKP